MIISTLGVNYFLCYSNSNSDWMFLTKGCQLGLFNKKKTNLLQFDKIRFFGMGQL